MSTERVSNYRELTVFFFVNIVGWYIDHVFFNMIISYYPPTGGNVTFDWLQSNEFVLPSACVVLLADDTTLF